MRRVLAILAGLVIAVALWEGYKAVGNPDGTVLFGTTSSLEVSETGLRMIDAPPLPHGLRDQFAIANQENWQLFLAKAQLRNDSIKELKIIVNRIWQFLEYPLREIHSDKQLQTKRWTHDNGWR